MTRSKRRLSNWLRRRKQRRPRARVLAHGMEWLEDRRVLSAFHEGFSPSSSHDDEALSLEHDVPIAALESLDDASDSPLFPLRSPLPSLPGLRLVDPHTNVDGQIIFLDFDGAEDVVYNGPVTVGPFDVPVFEAPGELAGQEEAIIASVLEQLEQTFAGSGVIFTTAQPVEGVEYSTVYIGGDDSAFREYGSFRGLAESIDGGNGSLIDKAFVFSANLVSSRVALPSYAWSLSQFLGHEAGHLLGFAHKAHNRSDQLDPLSAFAATKPITARWIFSVGEHSDGTYTTTSSHYVGFVDGFLLDNDTYRAYAALTMPDFSSRPAIDYIQMSWIHSPEFDVSEENWRGLDIVGLWTDPELPQRPGPWDAMTAEEQFRFIGNTNKTTVLRHDSESVRDSKFLCNRSR
ncbi:MAG: hypothetical protein QGF59_00660 [Pirellulaceae bacterium]|nr:hypothetical protein [Pirellulaceae bacterium]